MPADRPFIDPATGELETNRIIAEALPLAKLIGVFLAGSLLPYTLAFFGAENTALGALLLVVGHFVIAVGAGIALLYVIARGIQLADE